MRHGKQGFLDRGIRRLAICQDVPGNKRPVILFGRSIGPACAQQSLIRKWSLEADAIQGLFCTIKVGRFEKNRAKNQIGLVADCKTGGIDRRPQSGFVELIDRFLWSTGL